MSSTLSRGNSGPWNVTHLCVFCASSTAVAPVYLEAARELAAWMGRQGMTLIYGAGNIGLMGVLGPTVHQHGGRVVGIIPKFMRDRALAYESGDEVIETADLRERKALMAARAEAFLALPGGFGTLEELLEVITLKQLHQHAKPIVLLNTAGFFDPLLALFERLYTEQFTKPESRHLYHVAGRVEEVASYLRNYQPPQVPRKWF